MMPVTNVYDLERHVLFSQHNQGPYRQSRRRSKSREKTLSPTYFRDLESRFNSRTRSASRGRSTSRRRSNSMASSNNQQWKNWKLSLSSFINQLRSIYNQKTVSSVESYIQKSIENAVELNNVNFLLRCASHRMIPKEYWVDTKEVRKTREVLRFLEQCASRLMLEDIRQHKKLTANLSKSILELKKSLKTQLSAKDYSRLQTLLTFRSDYVFHAVRQRQRDAFEQLQRFEYKNGNQMTQKQGSPKKSSPGKQGRSKESGQKDSERKSRSGSDSSSVQNE